MIKQTVSHAGRQAPCRQTAYKVQRLLRCHIKHHQIGDKKQKRPAQILGQHQHNHMQCRHNRCHDHILKCGAFAEPGRRKKHKADFHKLRRLKGKTHNGQGQLGSIAAPSKNRYGRQQQQARPSVYPGKLLQKGAFADKHRDHHGKHQSHRRHLKLTHSLIIGKPCQHNKTDSKQKTHVIEHQTVHFGINNPAKHKNGLQHKKLKQVKNQNLNLLGLKIKHHIGQQMKKEHQQILKLPAVLHFALAFLCQNRITQKRIKGNQNNKCKL